MFNTEQQICFLHYKTNPARKGCYIYTGFLLKNHCLQGKLIECFKILNSFTSVDLFVTDDSTQTRNNGAKLKCIRVHSDYRKFFYTNAVIWDWNRLPSSPVQCNSIVSFKNNLHHHLLHLSVHSISFIVMIPPPPPMAPVGSYREAWWCGPTRCGAGKYFIVEPSYTGSCCPWSSSLIVESGVWVDGWSSGQPVSSLRPLSGEWKIPACGTGRGANSHRLECSAVTLSTHHTASP